MITAWPEAAEVTRETKRAGAVVASLQGVSKNYGQ